ncbi:hypothetical protein K458DRAFT_202416 [Lentithecium fluviatile CBS 122367]|uniref:Uncharacterized protein n=1 Tax=Lentithecium fluviatile CBS 122367 TaxID=1168545 RepID=A0A6G1J892_9PLEO|nr:hypothetical protein K458DRAFT_202416 [Lentithecium fluviatile CBS 122367]
MSTFSNMFAYASAGGRDLDRPYATSNSAGGRAEYLNSEENKAAELESKREGMHHKDAELESAYQDLDEHHQELVLIREVLKGQEENSKLSYEQLEVKYDDALGRIRTHQVRYHELSQDRVVSQDECHDLRIKYQETVDKYDKREVAHEDLQRGYEDIPPRYDNRQDDHENLEEVHAILAAEHGSLQSEHKELSAWYDVTS